VRAEWRDQGWSCIGCWHSHVAGMVPDADRLTPSAADLTFWSGLRQELGEDLMLAVLCLPRATHERWDRSVLLGWMCDSKHARPVRLLAKGLEPTGPLTRRQQ